MYLIVLDYGHSCDLAAVVIALHELLAVAAVYLTDYIEYARDYAADEVDIPFFESLCHDRMIGVCKGIRNDMPALCPAVAAVIEEYPHELGDSECGVGIVDMDSDLLVEIIESAVYRHMSVYDIAYRRCAHEILLTQTERFALEVVVVGIEHLGYRLSDRVLAESLFVIALIEHTHIERRSLCLPQTEHRNALVAISGNIHIIRNGNDRAVILIGDMVILLIPVFLQLAVKMDLYSFVLLGNEPYLAAGEPVVGELGLPAVLDLLLEDTVFIADRIAHCGISVCCGAVEIAGGKTSETAVSETCVGFVFIDMIEVHIPVLQKLFDHIIYLEIEKARFERAPHEEFHRDIIYLLFALGMRLVSEFSPSFAEYLDNNGRQCLVYLVIRCFDRCNIEICL